MLIQLDPVIWLNTPKGVGYAILVYNEGFDHHLVWVTVIAETGEIWAWENPQVRAPKNITSGVNLENQFPT